MKNRFVAAFVSILLACTGAQAIPLAGQYTIESSATHISGNMWRFDYQVSNINQSGPYAGLDGFRIMAPKSASVISWTNPAPYWGSPGYWDFHVDSSPTLFLSTFPTVGIALPADQNWLAWWGNGVESVYPAGKTASFSVILDHVMPSTNTAAITTYWWLSVPSVPYDHVGANYTTYTTAVIAPVAMAVPEPGMLAMMLVALALVRVFSVRRH